jgi:hypothetical protein
MLQRKENVVNTAPTTHNLLSLTNRKVPLKLNRGKISVEENTPVKEY